MVPTSKTLTTPWRSQPCLRRCHPSSSPNPPPPALKTQMKSSTGGNTLLSWGLPQAKTALERKRLYLIVSTLKAGLCLMDEAAMSISHSVLPQGHACKLRSELFTECWMNACFLPAPGGRAARCVYSPTHCQFHRYTISTQTGPTPSHWADRSSGTLSRTVPHLLSPSIGAPQHAFHGLPGFWGYRNATDHLNEFYLFISDLKTELAPVKSPTSL